MDSMCYGVALLLILSKYMDCRSTAKNITGIGDEQNPLARRLMEVVGIQTSIWIVFAVTVVIVTLAVALARQSVIYQWLFIILGIAISLVQIAVARHNTSGRVNCITKRLVHITAKLSK